MLRRLSFLISVLFSLTRLLLGLSLLAQSPLSARPADRAVFAEADSQLIRLAGNHHPLAQAANLVGSVAPDTRLEQAILVLRPDAAQQRSLDALLEGQQDPASPYFHQWLTPESFGEHFGVSESDLQTITAWLTDQGFTVDEIPAGHRSLIFSGSSSRFESAFHLRMQRYAANGMLHLANSTDPAIPSGLAAVVAGVVSLHDFRSEPQHLASPPRPAYTSGSNHYLAPADFAAIYGLTGLYGQYIDGTGQAIAVVGRSNIHPTDVRQFRSFFGLPAHDPVVVLNGSDPGTASSGDVGEATLDVEWSGAVAKNATVYLVSSASTNVSDGTYLSAQYIVNHNLAPILTYSYGLCESWLGAAENAFLNSLWQQAAAQGISVFVSSGDSGAAGCDASSSTRGTGGRAVNGLCSTPNNTCVGGTQLNDTANPALYWSSSNGTGGASARSYIPEAVWNESGPSGLWASGGGASLVYAKPTWQSAAGVPADGMRDVPDVALAAAGHDGYLVTWNGANYAFSGTSAAAPAMAGVMALVEQMAGARQGNVNPALYKLATRQQTGAGATIFHDTVTGTNSVPGVTGFAAAAGYDQATGLGSLDAQSLATHWSDASTAAVPSLSLTVPAALTVTPGGSGTVSLSTSVSGGFSSAVALSVTGLPAGATAVFSPATLAAPGSGSSSLRISTTTATLPGTYMLGLKASSPGYSKLGSLSISILPAPSFTLSSSLSTVSVLNNGSATANVSVTANNTFAAPVTLAVTGLPGGLTAKLTPSMFNSPGSGTGTLLISASATVAAGSYSATLSASGGGLVRSLPLTIQVPNLALTISASSLTLTRSSSGSVNLATSVLGGFSAPVTFGISGLPSGVAASIAPLILGAPGGGSSKLSLGATAIANVGSFSVQVTASGGGISRTAPLLLNVVAPVILSFGGTASALNVSRGSSESMQISTAGLPPFQSAVTWKISGLPAGLTASFAPPVLPSPGTGSTSLTLSAASNVAPRQYALTITAAGATTNKTSQLLITVQ